MKVRKRFLLPPLDQNLVSGLNLYLSDIVDAINDNTFGDRYQTITVDDTGLANTAFTVAHNLRKIPEGFLVLNQNVAGSLYLVAWTNTQVTFKFSENTATLVIKLY